MGTSSRATPGGRGSAMGEKDISLLQTANGTSWIRDIPSRERTAVLAKLLEATPVIPAIRSQELISAGSRAPGKIVYFLFGNPEDIAESAGGAAALGKVPIVNLDLFSGLARDSAAVSFLARRNVQGIISTHPEPLRAARDCGLFAVKRTFLLDSAALHTALRSVDQFLPDALEVLPAMAAPHIVARLREEHPQLPVIAGGLVHTLREVEDLLQQGITSVSVSDCKLWVA